MDEITLAAHAKINLSLDIVSRLPDGYHAMRMVMLGTTLCDDVTIRRSGDGRIYARSDLRYLPNDDRNVAVKAARLFLAEVGLEGEGLVIGMKKRIPVCAGLGGGSSDAAAVLRGLNRMYAAGLSREQLEKLAFRVGADVPFCVRGGTALAEGKGEKLTDLAPMPACRIVICKPGFSISTPALFSRIRCEKIRNRPDTAGMVTALERGDLQGVACRCFNVFEGALERPQAEVGVIKRRMLDSGALGTAMTGSGSAVFGIFDDAAAAARAHEVLRGDYRDCFLAAPCGPEEI